MSKETSYAYAAGLIDGEGTITLGRERASSEFRHPIVSIPSTTPELVEFMRQVFTGTISNKVSLTGHTPSKTWRVCYGVAVEFLELTLPYLQEPEKVRRAQLLINEYRNLTPRNGKYSEEQRKKKLDFEKRFFETAKRQKNRIRW